MKNGQYGLLSNICNFKTTIIAFTLICFFKPAIQMLYKAAVVEYAPKREFDYLPRHIVIENTKEYINLIDQAASMETDIIVFPENGLTTSEVNQKVSDHLESYGVEFPSTVKDTPPNPCDDTLHVFPKVFVDLSCAAKRGKIYVVINLVETETINENDNIFNMHSTNYVFDKKGTIIKQYRKINFHNDLGFTHSSQETETFTTDFGVTFGLLIGADILYKKPATELLKNLQVTDVIYTTTWCSEIPFLNGISIQHGYAKANRINLLASSLNDPSYNSSGSGIFLANGSIADTFISGSKGTKLLIQNISTRSIRLSDGKCEVYDETSYERKLDDIQSNVGSIKTAVEDMQNYTFEPLDFSNKKVIEGCSAVNSFCCFNIDIGSASNFQSNYNYKLASFVGARNFGSGSRANTIGVSVCALVACLNENSSSCGIRNVFAPNLTFNSISISVTLPPGNYFQPTTLKYDLLPVIDYFYCAEDIEISIKTTNSLNSLLSFGIFGRIYDNDNKIAGPISYTGVNRLKTQVISNHEYTESYATVYIIAIIVISVTAVAVAIIIVVCKVKTKRGRPTTLEYELQTRRSAETDLFDTTLLPSNQASSSSSNFLPPGLKKMSDNRKISPRLQDTNQPYTQLGYRKELLPHVQLS